MKQSTATALRASLLVLLAALLLSSEPASALRRPAPVAPETSRNVERSFSACLNTGTYGGREIIDPIIDPVIPSDPAVDFLHHVFHLVLYTGLFYFGFELLMKSLEGIGLAITQLSPVVAIGISYAFVLAMGGRPILSVVKKLFSFSKASIYAFISLSMLGAKAYALWFAATQAAIHSKLLITIVALKFGLASLLRRMVKRAVHTGALVAGETLKFGFRLGTKMFLLELVHIAHLLAHFVTAYLFFKMDSYLGTGIISTYILPVIFRPARISPNGSLSFHFDITTVVSKNVFGMASTTERYESIDYISF